MQLALVEGPLDQLIALARPAPQLQAARVRGDDGLGGTRVMVERVTILTQYARNGCLPGVCDVRGAFRVADALVQSFHEYLFAARRGHVFEGHFHQIQEEHSLRRRIPAFAVCRWIYSDDGTVGQNVL